MAFARQQTDRRTLELAAFSLPAVAACLALLLIPHGHSSTQAALQVAPVAPVALELPPVSPTNTMPTPETISVTPMVSSDPPPPATLAEANIPLEAVPQVDLTPNDGFGQTTSQQAPEIAPSRPHAIIVQAGHTLWRIARETYGYGRNYPLIVDANRQAITKPELIHPGQQLVLPDMKAN